MHLRDRALWEEEFTLDEPIVPGGHTEFKKLHTIGFDGWTISKYRQSGGPTPDGEPEHIMRDMDIDGVDAAVMFPNLSLFVLFTDDHELSMAHARVYNDWSSSGTCRTRTGCARRRPSPSPHIPDAVAEIERVARLGSRPSCCPRSRRCPTGRASTTRCGRRPRRTGCRSSSTSPPAG